MTNGDFHLLQYARRTATVGSQRDARPAPGFSTFLGLSLCLIGIGSMSTLCDASAHKVHHVQTKVYVRTYQAALRQESDAAPIHAQRVAGSNSFSILNTEYSVDNHWRAGASYQYTTMNPLSSAKSTSNLIETYMTYDNDNVYARIGNQMYTSPWAYSHLTLGMAPSSFQGMTASYGNKTLSINIAGITRFDRPGGTSFSRTTLLSDLSANSTTNGFLYGHIGITSSGGQRALHLYAYKLDNLATLLWASGVDALRATGWKPTIAAQWGSERSTNTSYAGRIASDVTGAEFSVTPVRNITTSFGIDSIPWRHDTTVLPLTSSCDSAGRHPTYALSEPDARGLYFLPQGVAQCKTNGPETTVYYGGWASPYTDGYAWDPLFTTGAFEGQADRRSPGLSTIAAVEFFDQYGHIRLDSNVDSFNYSNPIAAQRTTEWDTIVRLYARDGHRSPYHGLLLTYFNIQVRNSNTLYPSGETYLGGKALTAYRRLQLEYLP